MSLAQWRVVLLWAAWRLTFANDRCDNAAQQHWSHSSEASGALLVKSRISEVIAIATAPWAISRTSLFSSSSQEIGDICWYLAVRMSEEPSFRA